jgi:hypothetical protein
MGKAELKMAILRLTIDLALIDEEESDCHRELRTSTSQLFLSLWFFGIYCTPVREYPVIARNWVRMNKVLEPGASTGTSQPSKPKSHFLVPLTTLITFPP